MCNMVKPNPPHTHACVAPPRATRGRPAASHRNTARPPVVGCSGGAAYNRPPCHPPGHLTPLLTLGCLACHRSPASDRPSSDPPPHGPDMRSPCRGRRFAGPAQVGRSFGLLRRCPLTVGHHSPDPPLLARIHSFPAWICGSLAWGPWWAWWWTCSSGGALQVCARRLFLLLRCLWIPGVCCCRRLVSLRLSWMVLLAWRLGSLVKTMSGSLDWRRWRLRTMSLLRALL
jgi:hypothetical protein